jgi:hypothetical protein
MISGSPTGRRPCAGPGPAVLSKLGPGRVAGDRRPGTVGGRLTPATPGRLPPPDPASPLQLRLPEPGRNRHRARRAGPPVTDRSVAALKFVRPGRAVKTFDGPWGCRPSRPGGASGQARDSEPARLNLGLGKVTSYRRRDSHGDRAGACGRLRVAAMDSVRVGRVGQSESAESASPSRPSRPVRIGPADSPGVDGSGGLGTSYQADRRRLSSWPRAVRTVY